jgi:hypothetical protein
VHGWQIGEAKDLSAPLRIVWLLTAREPVIDCGVGCSDEVPHFGRTPVNTMTIELVFGILASPQTLLMEAFGRGRAFFFFLILFRGGVRLRPRGTPAPLTGLL